MAVALVLATRGSEENDVLELRGRTSRGFAIKLVVSDGKLGSFDADISVRCPRGEPYDWRWSPSNGSPVPFHQNGSRFYVRERSDFPDRDSSVKVVGVMRGELEDSGRVARGTISSRAVWASAGGVLMCTGNASFSAREASPAQ